MPSKLHSKQSKSSTQRWVALPICGLLMVLWVSAALAAPVAEVTARRVAENTLRQHVALYGDWNGTIAPAVGPGAAIVFSDSRVAYNFSVQPSGHVLVAVDDLISPVLLYSTRSTFDPSRADRPQTIESWIVPEVHRHVRRVREAAAFGSLSRAAANESEAGRRIARAWTSYGGESSEVAMRGTPLELSAPVRGATVEGLLETAWGQEAPYNLQTPAVPDDPETEGDQSCTNALTGCVATAWAQLMRYWRWPLNSTGSITYDAYYTMTLFQSISVDFGAEYAWDNMPNTLAGSSDEQKDAVALLMFHAGVAAHMDYGCDSSGSGAWAHEVLDVYFGYGSGMTYYGPAELSDFTVNERFALLKAELDADPPRPVILSIFATDDSGHEVVVDGYRTTDTENMVHINFGWDGNYSGYYNIGANFQTGSIEWDATTHHFVVGIQPDNDPPVVSAGDDQSVAETATVQLAGSANDPEDVGLTYRWTQTGGPTVVLSDATSATPTFTAPSVHTRTTLVFELRADDLNRAWAADSVSVTIANSDGSSAVSGGGGGGGGGGCFIVSLGTSF